MHSHDDLNHRFHLVVIRRNSPREKLESLLVTQFRARREERHLKQKQITGMKAMLLLGFELRPESHVTSYPQTLTQNTSPVIRPTTYSDTSDNEDNSFRNHIR